ncbi:SgcJ/EcaC family oxidoreductase [Aphanothece sacrum]|uniref:Methyl-accepting chemotaxis protein n=1 Tax=Aphanothece sacrum FPU1 TaxID=1920663 RepID=A0A401IKY1_APHSA|nr:SgcJ/EcaC family oxidoreductase [Aphanothece sacrum]GBF81901.1 methyl-accepting chemotaxis protein [Aphanothece sacrum FPU1]GBF83531.1 methyl-accepting chemotaxis protein [Aphanothece sacrum FPU3]
MNQNQIIIQQAIKACIDKNAVTFASLFAENGEIILNNNRKILKPEIAKVTADYFANLAYINIEIKNISVAENKALIDWTWQDYNTLTGKQNCQDNVISIHFTSGLISSWQENKVLSQLLC